MSNNHISLMPKFQLIAAQKSRSTLNQLILNSNKQNRLNSIVQLGAHCCKSPMMTTRCHRNVARSTNLFMRSFSTKWLIQSVSKLGIQNTSLYLTN